RRCSRLGTAHRTDDDQRKAEQSQETSRQVHPNRPSGGERIRARPIDLWMFGPRRGREYQQCVRNLSNMRATLFSFESSIEGVALPRSSATSNLLSAKAIETTRCARYSGGFNPRNSSIRMRRRALVVRS